MTGSGRVDALDVDAVEDPTPATALGAVTAEVFAGEAHLGGDAAAACDVDVSPETHYPNEVELRVSVDGLEVLIGLDDGTVRQLHEVLKRAAESDDVRADSVGQQNGALQRSTDGGR